MTDEMNDPGDTVSELELHELFTTAARASINERCASAFLHDVRGTMQALVSAFELLGRSAKMSESNLVRVEKVCELARRAISQHEKSTLNVLRLLTLQQNAATTVNLGELLNEVTHFLRNDAATKYVTVAVSISPDVNVSAERTKLQTLLVGLMTAAIDESPTGVELSASVYPDGADAVICIASHSGFTGMRNMEELLDRLSGPLHSRELTLLFAQRFLAANGGRLEIDDTCSPEGAVRLYYPGIQSPAEPFPAHIARKLPGNEAGPLA